MPKISTERLFRSEEYYRLYEAMRGLGLNVKQAIQEINLLYLEDWEND